MSFKHSIKNNSSNLIKFIRLAVNKISCFVINQVFFKQSFTNYQKVQSLAFDTLLRSDLCDDPQTREHVLDWQEASSRMSVSVHFQTMPDNVEDFKAYIEFNFNDDDED